MKPIAAARFDTSKECPHGIDNVVPIVDDRQKRPLIEGRTGMRNTEREHVPYT
jgi:hypothetical protein